ncbi:MAG: ATP-binding protein [Microlunatus sp.]|nr:ATP-binding protein [Microlunatus sp.]MDN5771232.1 ATP-binding protein [Microlunatus sp.]
MAGPSSTQDQNPPPTTAQPSRLVVLVVVVVVGLIGLVLASDLPGPIRQVTSGAGLVAGGVALAGACRGRYVRSSGRQRPAWLLFGCAALAAAAGNLAVTVGYLADWTELRAVGRLLLIGGLALAAFGLMSHPAAWRRSTDLVRVLLDGVILAGSVLLVLSLTIAPQFADKPVVTGLALLAPPILDILLITFAWLLFLRSTPRDRSALALATVAFTLFAVSDLTAAVRRSFGTFAYGSIGDLGWISGFAVLTLAVMSSRADPGAVEQSPRNSPVAGTLLMFAIVMLAGALTLNAVARATVSLTVVLLLGLVLVAIIARQVLLLIDNDRLREGLEARVIQRTAELADATQRIGLLINSVEDGVYGVDGQGRLSFLNPAGARLLGVQPDTLLDRPAHQAFHSHPLSDCYLRTIVATGLAITSVEDSYRTADGRLVWVEVTASPMVEGTGVRGVVVVFRDVTRRREVDRMKTEFVSLVSHELKTPLTAIRGSLGLLAGGALGELAAPATRMVEIALESSERLTRLINEILDMERIESGALPMEIAVHDAGDLLRAAHDQVQVLAGEAEVQVRLIPVPGKVLVDADRVVQTLINLVGNAIKFSPPGSTVTLEVVSTSGDDDELLFRVIDGGRGIPAGRLEAIFERFEQVDSSDARQKGGTGLGLAICRSIVERLDGRIWAENNDPGPGATFSFTLPAVMPSQSQGELVDNDSAEISAPTSPTTPAG